MGLSVRGRARHVARALISLSICATTILLCAGPSLAADWVTVRFPAPYTNATADHHVAVVTQDQRGGVWAATSDGSVFVLRAGSAAWSDVTQGLHPDSDLPGPYDILAEGDKVVLSTESSGVWIRGLAQGPWRQVSKEYEPQIFYLVRFDGAVWSTGSGGPQRLDLATEKWREVSAGIPHYAGSGTFAGAAQGDLATTATTLYFGLTETAGDNPRFSYTGVYGLRKGAQTWENTGLHVSLTAHERDYLKTHENADVEVWGPDLLWSSGDYVLCDWGGLSSADEAARFYVFDQSRHTWDQVPSPPGESDSRAVLRHLAPVYAATSGTPKFSFVGYPDVKSGTADAPAFDPSRGAWDMSATLPVVGWPASDWYGWDDSWHWVLSRGRIVVGAPEGGYAAPVQKGFVASVPLPTQVSRDPAVIGTNLVFALLFAVVFGFTATLFNSTLRENNEAIMRPLRPLAGSWRRLARRMGGGRDPAAAPPSRAHRLIEATAVVLVGALIYAFLDPGFGFSMSGLALYLSLAITVAVVTCAYEGVQCYYCSRRLSVPTALRFYPAALLIAIACVVVSRLIGFSPGYLYGFAGSIAFLSAVRPSREGRGRIVLLSGVVLLAISLGTWFLAVPVTHAIEGHDLWILHVLQGATIGVFVAGLESLFFGLIPLTFMEGESLLHWNRWVWLATFTFVAFAFWHVLLNKDSRYAATFGNSNTRVMLMLLVVFSLVTVATFFYFRARGGGAIALAPAGAGSGRIAAPAAPTAPTAPQPAAEAAPAPTASIKACPVCRATVPTNEVVCPYCGHGATATYAGGWGYCPWCASSQWEGLPGTCAWCGSPLQSVQSPATAAREEPTAATGPATEPVAEAPPAPAIDVVRAQPDVPALLRELADLRDEGVITEAEFEQKKTEILGRL
jgi:hypothetical protein